MWVIPPAPGAKAIEPDTYRMSPTWATVSKLPARSSGTSKSTPAPRAACSYPILDLPRTDRTDRALLGRWYTNRRFHSIPGHAVPRHRRQGHPAL